MEQIYTTINMIVKYHKHLIFKMIKYTYFSLLILYTLYLYILNNMLNKNFQNYIIPYISDKINIVKKKYLKIKIDKFVI